MNSKKYIIFDFEGVFLDSFESTIQTYMINKSIPSSDRNNILEDLSNNRWVNTRYSVDKDYTPEQWSKMVKDRIEEFTQKSKLGLPLFDGFVKEVFLIQDYAKLAIVSTADQEQINNFAKSSGIKFDFLHGFSSKFDKINSTKIIMKEWGVAANEVYFVTDTLRDVNEISTILPITNIYGCAWGFHGFAKLSTKLPESNILSLYSDIKNILNNN
ncbi:MAG: HAD family hydrolase [Patescibacteria group bacterium]